MNESEKDLLVDWGVGDAKSQEGQDDTRCKI